MLVTNCYFFPSNEKELWLLLKIINHLVSKNIPWTVIDAGAHLGEFLLASRYRLEQVVLGFEPNPDAYASLRKSITFLPDKERFQVFKLALSDQIDRKDFYIDEVKSKSPSFYLTESFRSRPRRISVTVDTIYSLLLDKRIAQHTAFCLMRVSAEGEGLKIIHGVRKYISTCEECIIFMSFAADHFAEAGENVRLQYERLINE